MRRRSNNRVWKRRRRTTSVIQWRDIEILLMTSVTFGIIDPIVMIMRVLIQRPRSRPWNRSIRARWRESCIMEIKRYMWSYVDHFPVTKVFFLAESRRKDVLESYPSFARTISPILSFNCRRSGETTFELRKLTRRFRIRIIDLKTYVTFRKTY